MKKAIALLLCAVMLLGLVACGSGNTEQTTAPAAQAAGTEAAGTEAAAPQPGKYDVTEPITIEFWINYSEQPKQEWIQGAVDAFNASQELVTVELVLLNGYGAVDEALTAAQAAGKGLPGLANINCPRVLTYATSGLTEPLDDYMAATGFPVDDFNEGMMAAMQPLADPDHYYGIPFGISSSVCYWNLTLLNECGITEVPTTWEQMRAAADIIKDKTGKMTLGIPSELNYVEVMMRNAGADPLGDGTASNLYDENVVSFVQELKEMYDAGQAEVFDGTDYTTNIATAFYAGDLACMVNTSSIANAVAKNSAEANIEVTATFGIQYKADPCISCVAGGALIVPAANDQQVKNAAWQFIQFLTSKENVASWSIPGAVYATRYSVLEDEALVSAIYENCPMMEGIYAGFSGVVSKNKTPYQTAAYKILLNAMGQYLHGNADFDTVWSSANDEIDYLLAGY